MILLAATLGMGVGAVAGFVLSVLQLTLKRWRNGRLIARGEPPYKDALRIRLETPCAVVGLLASAGVFVACRRWSWAAGAALALPLGLFCLTAAFTVAQARRPG